MSSSCSHKIHTEVIGEYQSTDYSFVEKVYQNIFTRTSFIVGVSLKLKNDSTFYYQTCSSEMVGSWQLSNDSLVLDVTDNQWRNDSLKKYGYDGKWPETGFEMKFEVSGSKLVKIDHHDFLLSSTPDGNPDTLEIKRSYLKLEKSR